MKLTKMIGILVLFSQVASADIYESAKNCSEGDSLSTGSCAVVAALCKPKINDPLIDRISVSYASSHIGATVQMTSFRITSSEYTDDLAGDTKPLSGDKLLVTPSHKPDRFQGILDYSIPLATNEAFTVGWIVIRDIKLVTSLDYPHGKFVFGKSRKVSILCKQL